jgi:hypothetical protein
VDQSKASLDKGGAATLDAWLGLSPPDKVQVIPAILPKSKLKGPLVRCLAVTPTSSTSEANSRLHLDVSQVDSVDKVYRLLTHHLKVPVSNNPNEYEYNTTMENGRLAWLLYDRVRILNSQCPHFLFLMLLVVVTVDCNFLAGRGVLLMWNTNIYDALIQGISAKTCECLKWKYKGNGL